MEKQGSGRPISTRPPSAVPVPRSAMTSAASRPITQQGLTGLRPPPTSGGGTNRIYRDKRYYISRMQAHMNTIREEVNRLNKSTLDYRVASLNRQEMRKTAERTAKELTEKQELLTVYNTALDMHLSKTRTDEIITETEELKAKNDMLLKELDGVFQKKLKKEEEITDLTKKISDEEEFLKSLIEKLSPEAKEKYYNLADENRKTLDNITNMQQKIKDAKALIEKYKANIVQSVAKQKKLQLLRNLSRLEVQKTDLEAFVQNTLTPAQQREKLLEQVKEDKSNIESLLKVKSSIEEDLASNETRLVDLEHELDGKDNARLKKHKELRERGEHMEKFITEYEEKSIEIKGKIDYVNKDIGYALEHMSENLAEINLNELEVKFDASEQNTIEGWTSKYKLLQSQITRISSVKEKYEREIMTMRERMDKMHKEYELYKNIEKGKEELMERQTNYLERRGQLQNTLNSTKAAVIEAQKSRDELKKRIDENEDYNEIMGLERRIEETQKENVELASVVESEMSNSERDSLLKQLDELLAKRNTQLIQNLKKTKSKTINDHF